MRIDTNNSTIGNYKMSTKQKKKIDINVIKKEDFENKISYNAALHAVELINRVIDFYNKGYWLVKEDLIKTNFIVKPSTENNHFELLEEFEGQYRNWVIGDTLSLCGEKVYLTKKSVNEYFKDRRYIHTNHIVRIK